MKISSVLADQIMSCATEANLSTSTWGQFSIPAFPLILLFNYLLLDHSSSSPVVTRFCLFICHEFHEFPLI